MIIDVTGTILIPGNEGNNCLGNGEHYDENGELIECCCDECDYMLCCLDGRYPEDCKTCVDQDCPHAIGEYSGNARGKLPLR